MRYLLLVLLCIIVLPGAALAADSWAVTGQDVPATMTWDQTSGASVDVNNDGTTTWDATYALDSVVGPTLTPTVINRWGLSSTPVLPVPSTIAPGGDYTFDFDVTAPPLTSLKYNLPIGPTTVAVKTGLDNNWQMAGPGGAITTALSANSTVVRRFSDVLIGVPVNDWAVAQIEECAGQVPPITTGYADGTFKPTVVVNRVTMAVFMARALKLPLLPYADTFTDVSDTDFGAKEIQALVATGVVKGYADGTFRPNPIVDRATMAVFVARGMAGGDDNVVTPAVTKEFTDCNTSTPPASGGWAYKYVQYCVDNRVVTGYADNTYRPLVPVDRATMVVFMYRAFIQPTGATVVLAGPAITRVNPATAGYDGWSSTSAVSAANSGTAYVGFDAVRFSAASQAVVTFSLYDAGDIGADGLPVAAATPLAESGDVTVDVVAAKAAALTTGVPYTYATWAIPSTLADGDYKLLTTVNGVLLKREPSVTMVSTGTSAPLVGSTDAAAIADAAWDMVSGRQATSGSDADLAASDDTYLVSERLRLPTWTDSDGGMWCDGTQSFSLIWKGIPKDAASLELTLEYKAVNPNDGTWNGSDPVDTGCCASSCCGEWGTLDPAWSLVDGGAPVHTPVYTFDLNGDGDPEYPNTAPLGWGLSIQSGVGGGYNWWDTDGQDLNDDGDDDFWLLQGSGDPMKPGGSDVVGGGDMFPSQGFTGFAHATDTVEHWGTTNVARYVNGDGTFVVTFCGGSIQYLSVDQAVVTFTLP